MSIVVSEGQVIGGVMRFLRDRLEIEHNGIKKALEPAPYMRCCGRIEAYDGVLAELRDLIKRANGGLTDEEETA